MESKTEVGASTIKWTTLNPCLVFSESNSILYTNFCEVKYHRHFKNILIHNAKTNYDDKNNSKKSQYILEDGTSGVQVGDIEQTIIYNFLKVG